MRLKQELRNAKMNAEIKLFLNAHGTMFVGKNYDYSQRILKLLIWPDDDDEFNYGNEWCSGNYKRSHRRRS